MKNYEKPVVLVNDEIAEGVYMASGDCYTVTYKIHQAPQMGRINYRIQFDARHDADHHSTQQTLKITFNQPVDFDSCNGICTSGSGTNTLLIDFVYHNNNTDNIGLGELSVLANEGLDVTSVVLYCNKTCEAHN